MDVLIDYDAALDRLGGDEEFLIELLGELSSQISENLETIEAKLTEKDFEGIGRIGHGLRGASANLDVKGITELSAQLEQRAEEKNIEVIQNLVSEIKKGNAQLKKYLEDI